MLALTLVLLTVSGDLGTPHSARLLTDTPLLAQALPPAPPVVPQPQVSDTQASVQQLQVDIDALRRMRPSIGGGVALVSTGGGFALFGGFFMLMAAMSSSLTGMLVSNPFFVLAIGSFVIGAPLLVVGIWLVAAKLDQRKLVDAELESLRWQLQERQKQMGPRPQQYQRYMPQPEVLQGTQVPAMTVATF